jgi:hypothetical protein
MLAYRSVAQGVATELAASYHFVMSCSVSPFGNFFSGPHVLGLRSVSALCQLSLSADGDVAFGLLLCAAGPPTLPGVCALLQNPLVSE